MDTGHEEQCSEMRTCRTHERWSADEGRRVFGAWDVGVVSPAMRKLVLVRR
jgi:hypothetical protein